MKLTVNEYGIAVGMVFLAIIGLTMFSGLWESTPTIKSMTDTNTGKLNPDTIRGSMTFDEIISISGIPFLQFKNDLNLSDNVTSDMQLKEVQKYLPGWETESLREYLREVQK